MHLLNANHESSRRIVTVEWANRIQSKGENRADAGRNTVSRYRKFQRGLKDEARPARTQSTRGVSNTNNQHGGGGEGENQAVDDGEEKKGKLRIRQQVDLRSLQLSWPGRA